MVVVTREQRLVVRPVSRPVQAASVRLARQLESEVLGEGRRKVYEFDEVVETPRFRLPGLPLQTSHVKSTTSFRPLHLGSARYRQPS